MKIIFFGNDSKESGGPRQVMRIHQNFLNKYFGDKIEIINSSEIISKNKIYKQIKDADIVHIHELWSLNTINIVKISEKFGIPYIFTFHGVLNNWSLKKNKFLKSLFLFFFRSQIFYKSSGFQFLNFNEYNEAKNLYINFFKKSFILQNGLDLSFQKSHIKNIKYKNFLGDKLNLIFLGRVHPKKGLKILIDAISLASSKNLNISLKIIGPSSKYSTFLKNIVKKSKISKQVEFLPPVFDNYLKQKYFSRSDFFILPSYDEADSIAIKEAIASGLPIIVTKECKVENVEKNKIGYHINHDPKQIIEKFQFIMSDHKNYNILSKNCFDFSKSNFDIINITKEYRNNLIEITSGVKYSDNWI